MEEVKSGLLAAAILGAVIGLLLLIVRYGTNQIIGQTPVDPNFINIIMILNAVYALFFILAGLFCGYLVAARASGARPVKGVYRDAVISGAVAGLIIWPGIIFIYYSRFEHEMLNFVLYGAYDLVKLVMLSVAGASIYSAFASPRHAVIDRWLTGAGVGIVGAIGVTSSVFVLWLVEEIFDAFSKGGMYESLFTDFAFDACMLIIGVLAGMATAVLIRRSASSPASYVSSTALAGLITGAVGYTMYIFFFTVLHYLMLWGSDMISDQWLYIFEQVIFGAITLAMMAIGGGVIYASYRGETKFISVQPRELEKYP